MKDGTETSQAAIAAADVAHVASRGGGGQTKIYGADNIKRYLQQHKPDYAKRAKGSQADQPHENTREAQRRLRQQERALQKKMNRFANDPEAVAAYERAGGISGAYSK